MKTQIKKIKTTLYLMITIFILLVLYFAIPTLTKRKVFGFVAFLGLLFLILGIMLLYYTSKSKIKGKTRLFLLITGYASICPFVFSILHNFFYALGILSENIVILNYLFEALHVASFIISILIAPSAFIVGIIFSLILLKKK